ncbi:MAG: S8 family serine peptidase [Thermoleophilaceae bacterium]
MREGTVVRSGLAAFALLMLGWLLAGVLANGSHAGAAQPRLPLPHPLVRDYAQISSSQTPPTEAQCFSAGRRCFTPQGIRASYNLQPLYDQGFDGRGHTIAIVDSYGSDTMAHDLHVFNQAFGLQSMCGEEGVTCQPGMPKFSTLALQGSPATKAPPSKSNSPGQEDKSAWALEVALDVETAHAVAPGANILLVTTPTAETLGVQGFPQMMAAEQYVVDHHLADVISQSFASAEEAFGSPQSIEKLRHAFKSAAENGVTVVGASGDTGTANDKKTPVGKGGTTISSQTVEWPASDPLVTGIGGTALCTDPNAATRVVDNADPPPACQAPEAAGQGEIVWDELSRGIATGGGFSHVFSRPDFQDVLPAGSTPIPDGQRGVPDVALQASPRTGDLVYISLPPDGLSGLSCGASGPCSTGWYDIGGTSLATPQWAGLIGIAAQMKGSGLGLINPALYEIASDPAKYASDFFDVTVGNNQASPDIPGYPATAGWDPTTGLGTPNAANLVPDLVAATS